MSKYLSTAASTEFDSEVKHQYQGMGKLRNTVTVRTGVVGDSYKFARMGSGIANQKATSASVTPMDISHARPTATLANWNAPEYTDIFDQAEVNYDEKIELAQTIAKAIRRREDQIIIDAIAGITYATSNDSNPATGLTIDVSASANFSLDLVQQAGEHFKDIETDDELHMALTAAAMKELLSETKVGSADYNAVKALMNGELDTFYGFKYHVIGTRAEGGLGGTTNDMFAYAWAKPSVGLAIGIDMKTEVNYIADRTSWLCNGIYKAGAVAREPQGIVRLQYDSAV